MFQCFVALFVLNYGLGGDHYYIFINFNLQLPTYLYCIRKCISYFPCRVFGSPLEIFCNDCSFLLYCTFMFYFYIKICR